MTIREKVADILKEKENAVIIELGAHNGSDTEWLRSACKSIRFYLAVEPDSRFWKFDRFGVTTFFPVAIADYNGDITLYLSDNDVGRVPASSSIRQPKLHLEEWPWCKFERTQTVACYTLDWLADFIKPVDLIWADIQGAEKDMVVGGKKTLSHTEWLMVESYQTEMYQGQATRAELLEMLKPDWEVVLEEWEDVLLHHR